MRIGSCRIKERKKLIKYLKTSRPATFATSLSVRLCGRRSMYFKKQAKTEEEATSSFPRHAHDASLWKLRSRFTALVSLFRRNFNFPHAAIFENFTRIPFSTKRRWLVREQRGRGTIPFTGIVNYFASVVRGRALGQGNLGRRIY